MADAIERWLPVVGYEGLYEISHYGRVRRSGAERGTRIGRVLRANASKGHLAVELYKQRHRRQFYIHRLVLEAFVGPRPAGHECNHKDGNKLNNHVANLEWTTRPANIAHAQQMGLLVHPRPGERNSSAKLTANQVAEIRHLCGTLPHVQIAARYGVSKSLISLIFLGKRWQGG